MRSLRVAGKDKRTAMVVIPDVVIESSNHIGYRQAVGKFPAFCLRQALCKCSIQLAIIRCIDVANCFESVSQCAESSR